MRYLTLTAAVVWFAAISCGMVGLWRYQATSAQASAAPADWPADTPLARAGRGMSLVMFVHPHCPCTRASVEELAWVMTRCHGQVTARVLFIRPAEAPADWVDTDLWRSASHIPGVAVGVDDDGAEARRFGATASGQVMLYDAAGGLRFSGGITPGRGHAGESAGREAVRLIAVGKTTAKVQAPVFGCALFDPVPSAGAAQGRKAKS